MAKPMTAMNEEQKAHLARIQEAFLKEHSDKFTTGSVEHAPTQLHKDFTVGQLNDEAIKEVLDLASYLYTNREQIKYLENKIIELESKISWSLDACEEQNGIRACKNCGLGL